MRCFRDWEHPAIPHLQKTIQRLCGKQNFTSCHWRWCRVEFICDEKPVSGMVFTNLFNHQCIPLAIGAQPFRLLAWFGCFAHPSGIPGLYRPSVHESESGESWLSIQRWPHSIAHSSSTVCWPLSAQQYLLHRTNCRWGEHLLLKFTYSYFCSCVDGVDVWE